jgi:hypothetical protein
MTSTSRSFWPLCIAVPFLLASDWSGQRIAFQPKAGATLSKTLELEVDQELEEMKVLVGGQDMSAMMPEFEMTMKHRRKLVFVDTYHAVGEKGPERLERTFEVISAGIHSSGSTPMGEQENDTTLESELEGLKVVFTHEDGEYQVAFAEGTEGDEDLLEGLEEDFDLRGFLPKDEVEEGASWSLDGEAIKRLLVPAGDLKLRPVEGSEAAQMPGMDSMNYSPVDLLDEVEGELEATFTGTRKEGDARVAVVRLVLDFSSAKDLTEMTQAATSAVGDQMGATMTVDSCDGEMEYEAEGELLWNLDTGLVQGLTLSGELRMVVDISMGMTMQGKSQDMEMSMSYGGNQTVTLTVGD